MDPLFRRLSFLLLLAKKKQTVTPKARFGKTSMHKLLYFLQEIMEVNIGYRFELYTYGPYDSAIMSDLDYANALGVLSLDYDQDSGYDISPGPRANALEKEVEVIEAEAAKEIDRLFELFGTLNAHELELRATFMFVHQEEPSATTREVIGVVKRLKPKYAEAELDAAISQLLERGLLANAE